MPSMNRFIENTPKPGKKAAAVVGAVAAGLITVAAVAPVTTAPEASARVHQQGGFKGMS